MNNQIDAYPPALEKAETALIDKRREAAQLKDHPRVGFALSGGGIRSATFSLGVFQALSDLKLLGKIDYLSTVSGGGYFGSFLGRLFTRDGIQQPADVEKVLLEEPSHTRPTPWATEVIGWLRENGRYLAPNGAGDALLAAAAVVRNWVAIQMVMATLVIAILLFAQIVRVTIEGVCSGCVGYEISMSMHLPWGRQLIWWSPYSIVAAAVFLVFAAPPVWSYWMIEKHTAADGPWINPIWGRRAAIVLSIVCLLYGLIENRATAASISAVVLMIAVLSVICGSRAANRARLSGSGDPMALDELKRILLTRQLKAGLIATGVVLAFVIVDSLGQTIYLVAFSGDHDLKTWAIGFFGPIVAFASVIQRLLAAAGAKSGGKRLGLPLSVLAGVGAIAVALMILVTLDVCSHGFAWGFGKPDSSPCLEAAPAKLIDAKQLSIATNEETKTAVVTAAEPDNKCPDGQVSPGHRTGGLLLFAFLVSGVFSYLFGRSWPFLNRSSQKTIYASRLIRAYLGASNPGRLGSDGISVTDVIDGDDLQQVKYWPRFAQLIPANGNGADPGSHHSRVQALHEKGAPLHLVNVTINETLDGRSQVEQHDRKGVGMAIGPAGISAGVTHHIVINDGSDVGPFTIYPSEGFKMFDYKTEPDVSSGESGFTGEPLTLGNWTSISGAAVSTGLGARTSLGASFLLGFANARLGYWWDSGVRPESRKETRTMGNSRMAGSLFTRMLPVQSFLLDEFLARFHGSARRWWYLTDGGHFENMGGYELIRRRLPMIVVIDAEDDADYTFEGIANLVRKARIDFGAEIRFFTEAELGDKVDDGVRRYFGTPEQLRRGVWKKEPVPDPNGASDANGKLTGKRLSIRPLDESSYSLAHAAIAGVKYAGDEEEKGLLLYIKPTLTGDEPSDVRRYHSEHPSFPQETTAEQFFDEAQWESYRKLGQHIAELIFKPATGEAGKFVPYKLRA